MRGWTWEQWRGLPAPRPQPGAEMRRACGCLVDPVVFGHWWCEGAPAERS